jgi:hypothetical protein
MFKPSEAKTVRFSPAHKVSRNFPVEYYILAGLEFRGAIVGYLSDRPIREIAVDADGLRYRFVGIAQRDINGRYDVFSLERGEWIVEPGLIYAVDQEHGRSAGRMDRSRASTRT